MREHHDFRVKLRSKLCKEQNGICGYCKKPIKGQPSLDHIIPLDAMEENDQNPENYIVTCVACNKRKGNHLIFTNLLDGEIYPMVDVPYFFHVYDIQYNHKDIKNQKGKKK